MATECRPTAPLFTPYFSHRLSISLAAAADYGPSERGKSGVSAVVGGGLSA
jgi:hypothetical protein